MLLAEFGKFDPSVLAENRVLFQIPDARQFERAGDVGFAGNESGGGGGYGCCGST